MALLSSPLLRPYALNFFTPEELPGSKYYIFGKECGLQLAEQLGVKLLGQIPLVQSVREAGDAGRPAVLQGHPPQAKALLQMTANLAETLGENVTV